MGAPTPGVAIGPEDLHGMISKLIEAVNDHTVRLEAVEREAKMVGDGIGVVGRHCQGAVEELRGHIATSISDIGKAMQTIDAALRASVDAASERFTECQRDEKELMMRTEMALTQLSAKVQEQERAPPR